MEKYELFSLVEIRTKTARLFVHLYWRRGAWGRGGHLTVRRDLVLTEYGRRSVVILLLLLLGQLLLVLLSIHGNVQVLLESHSQLYWTIISLKSAFLKNSKIC